MEKRGYVYIVASGRNGTLYIGVTGDLVKRAYEHREGLAEGFTRRYGCKLLVWFECHDRIDEAIRREKQIKEWRRAWKLREIEAANPDWNTCSRLSCRNWIPAFAGMTKGKQEADVDPRQREHQGHHPGDDRQHRQLPYPGGA